MANFERNMAWVYALMTVGLIISGTIAYLFANIPDLFNYLYAVNNETLTLTTTGWIVLLSPFIIILVDAILPKDIPAAVSLLLFIIFAGLIGASLSSVFLAYETEIIVKSFFITAGTFAVISIYSFTTDTDLTELGPCLIMALSGIIIAMIVNLFLHSSTMDFVISIIAVIVFVALTAYDTQKIEEELQYSQNWGQVVCRGALNLYLDFINLFLHILKIFSKKD